MDKLFLTINIIELMTADAFVVYLIAVSFITFLFYGADKHRAEIGAWRVPEKLLLALSVVGGAIGGFIGMKVFRHKTKREHWYFTLINLIGIIAHIAIFVLLLVI